LPVLMCQLPPDSHWATLSHCDSVAASAVPVVRAVMPTIGRARAVAPAVDRATIWPGLIWLGARWRPR